MKAFYDRHDGLNIDNRDDIESDLCDVHPESIFGLYGAVVAAFIDRHVEYCLAQPSERK